jgi:hypothetical protein
MGQEELLERTQEQMVVLVEILYSLLRELDQHSLRLEEVVEMVS